VLPQYLPYFLHPLLNLGPCSGYFRAIPDSAAFFCKHTQGFPSLIGLLASAICEAEFEIVASFAIRTVADLNPFITQERDLDGVPSGGLDAATRFGSALCLRDRTGFDRRVVTIFSRLAG